MLILLKYLEMVFAIYGVYIFTLNCINLTKRVIILRKFKRARKNCCGSEKRCEALKPYNLIIVKKNKISKRSSK